MRASGACVTRIETQREVRVVYPIASRPFLVASRWDLEVVVVDTNTFTTPARAIPFRLFRDLQDECRQDRPQRRESSICRREIVELGINIIKSRT